VVVRTPMLSRPGPIPAAVDGSEVARVKVGRLSRGRLPLPALTDDQTPARAPDRAVREPELRRVGRV